MIKRQGRVGINRALNCTRKMAEDHLGTLPSASSLNSIKVYSGT